MLVENVPHRFHFNDETIGNEEVGKILTQRSAILIKNRDWVLLDHSDPFPPQPMRKRVFVNLLQVSIPVIPMNRKTSFANEIAESKNVHKTEIVSHRKPQGDELF